MAKVLLINSNRFKHPWPVIPFGLCYIATSLELNGNHQVSFLDLCFSKDCEHDIRKSVQDFAPDVIGVSIRNIDDTGGFNVHFLLEDVKNDVIDFCKKEFHGPIVIGGPSVGISGIEMLDYFDLEYAIRGDGEAVMPEFVNRIENKQALEGLEGLIIRRGKKIIQDTEPFRVQDLDSLPFPQPVRFINLERYRSFGSALHVQTKRGCAFRCSYCTYNNIEGKKYRLRDPRLIAREIEILVKETGIRHIEFTDSIFNVPLSHTKEVLREVIRKNLNLRLHTMGLSPSAIDEELLDLMKIAGFNEVDIGAESMCDKILESLSKDFKCSDIIKTAELLKRNNIPVTWFIILGSISETRETVLETLNSIGKVASKWDLVFISTGIRVYNGAPLADQMLINNANCTSDNFLRPVKIEPEKISLEEIHSIGKDFSFRYPNFYFYEKEHIVPGWLLITGNFLLKIFHSRQPVWRLLIIIKNFKKVMGMSYLKRRIYTRKKKSIRIKTIKGFTLVRNK
jgi:anaerobic magnesium-protoporphyrin IX monomethyl ester cyclase